MLYRPTYFGALMSALTLAGAASGAVYLMCIFWGVSYPTVIAGAVLLTAFTMLGTFFVGLMLHAYGERQSAPELEPEELEPEEQAPEPKSERVMLASVDAGCFVDIKPGKLEQAARVIVQANGFPYAELVGRGKPLTRKQWENLRGCAIYAGLGEKSERTGEVTLTRAGRGVFGRLSTPALS